MKFGPVFIELFDAGAATDYMYPDDDYFNYQHLSLEVDDIHAFAEPIITEMKQDKIKVLFRESQAS